MGNEVSNHFHDGQVIVNLGLAASIVDTTSLKFLKEVTLNR
jgi:hypothetical protein